MAEKVFTYEEVAQHNKLGDCWLIISGKVYDVSQFLEDHPGGDEIILNASGKDATFDFIDSGHTSDAIRKREGFLIGSIDESSLPEDVLFKSSRHIASSTENSDSSNFWLYVLPLLIMGVAFLLRYYSQNNEEV